MAREKEHGEYGESMKKDTKAPPEEPLNAYYLRKQRTKESEFATDADAEYAERDRDADQETNFKDPDASFLNYKKWDRYGR